MELKDLKILIVDDDKDICEVLQTFFNTKDIHSDIVYNGKDAIKKLGEKKYNIVFLDNILPDIEGIKILKTGILKKFKVFIVLMTGHFNKKVIKETIKLGVNEFLIKPFKLNDINTILNRANLYLTSLYNFKEAVKRIEFAQMKIVCDNSVSTISSISKVIVRNVVDAGFFDEEDQVIVALNEVISNAILHGNLELDSKIKEESFQKFNDLAIKKAKEFPYKDRKVYINSFFDKKQFKIMIRDEGKGFDWKKYLSNYSSSSLLPYGRGLVIVLSIFDEVFWNEKGNEITLIKYKQN